MRWAAYSKNPLRIWGVGDDPEHAKDRGGHRMNMWAPRPVPLKLARVTDRLVNQLDKNSKEGNFAVLKDDEGDYLDLV